MSSLSVLEGKTGYERRGSASEFAFSLEPSRVVIVESTKDWEDILQQANVQGASIVAHFSAEWCAPCKYMVATFNNLSRTYTDLIFLHVDVDELKDLASKMEVKAMPTFLFIKEEEVVDRILGANKDELLKRVEAFYPAEGTRF